MELLALVIAALALFLAALSLGCQLATYSLDGRQVRVTLLHGTMGRNGFATGPVGRDEKPKNLSRLYTEGFTGKEVLGITVTNVGRAPVTVSCYSVGLTRGGFPFSPMGEAIGPGLPYRLEPGAETWYRRMRGARALVYASSAVAAVSHFVNMTVVLGTGDKITTRRRLDVGRTNLQAERRVPA